MEINITIYGGGEEDSPPQNWTRRRPSPPPPPSSDKLSPSETRKTEFCTTCNREGLIRSRFSEHVITCPDCMGRKFHLIANVSALIRYVRSLRAARVLELPNAGAFLLCLYIGLLPDKIYTGLAYLISLIF